MGERLWTLPKVNEAKNAVARPEERKFLGFSISNDGSNRHIAPKALDKFKTTIRDMTRRTRGVSLQQLIKELKPYLVGWRGYFGFCQTPEVLTVLEARIRRRMRLYLWRQWRTGQNRFMELRRRGRLTHGALAHVRSSGGPTSPAQRLFRLPRSSPPLCVVGPSTTQSNRRGTGAYARWCGRGDAARCPPIPINPNSIPNDNMML